MTKESYNFGVDTEAKQLYTETSGMTAKRLIVDEDYNIVDTETGEGLDDNQVFDLANELHEENEQLKKENKRLQRCINEIYTITRLEEV